MAQQNGEGNVESEAPEPRNVESKRLQQTQVQIDEVVDIMRVNVQKVIERDVKISDLDGRAVELEAGASQFGASAGKLKNKYWWKNCKMMLIMGGFVGVIVVIIIVWVATSYGGGSSDNSKPAVVATTTAKNTP